MDLVLDLVFSLIMGLFHLVVMAWASLLFLVIGIVALIDILLFTWRARAKSHPVIRHQSHTP